MSKLTNRLNLCIWGLPLYPVFWLILYFNGRALCGSWPNKTETTRALNWVYREFWNDEPERKIEWKCRRCGAKVVDFRCQCTESPSPWEPC